MLRFFLFIFFSLTLFSWVDESTNKVLHTDKDIKGRIIKQVTEGFEYGEGHFTEQPFLTH